MSRLIQAIQRCQALDPNSFVKQLTAKSMKARTRVGKRRFGPIRSIFKYKDLDEAIRRANNTSYGLGASVWGSDPVQLRAVASQLEAGTVWINQHAIRNPLVPASAYKESGLGVEFGPEGLESFCNLQVIATKQ